MAQQVKTPRLKEVLTGELNTGGAPIFADDLLMIQENNLKDFVNTNESLRTKLPFNVEYYNGGGPLITNFENGLILSGLEYDNTDPANPVISSGYILSGGEVCYYPGATFPTGLLLQGLVYLYKGAETTVNRVFNDGGNKQILTAYDCIAEQGTWDINGPTMPVGTGITATDQVVVIACGISGGGNNLAESNFSKRAALSINRIGGQVSKNPWVSGDLIHAATAGVIFPYFVSRINPDGSIDIKGGLTMAGGIVSSFITVARLLSENVATKATFSVTSIGSATDDPSVYSVTLLPGGNFYVMAPPAGFPATSFELVFNVNVLTTPTLDTPFTYDSDFMDIT